MYAYTRSEDDGDALVDKYNQYNDRWVWAPPRRTQRQPNASIPPISPSEKMNNNVINTDTKAGLVTTCNYNNNKKHAC